MERLMVETVSPKRIDIPLLWARFTYGCSTARGRLWIMCLVLLNCLAILIYLILDGKRELAMSALHLASKTDTSAYQAPSAHSTQSSLQSIYEQIPPETELNARIASILQIATQHGLVYNKAVYSRNLVTGSRLQKCVINLPVLGTYPQLRLFIRQSMQENPSLALQSFNVTREDVTSDSISATLLFNLYVQQMMVK